MLEKLNMFTKISSKVTVLVNVILFIVMATGTGLLINQQFSSLETQYQDSAKFITIIGAKSFSRILEEGIDNGALTMEEAFDTNYIPIPNTDPQKYRTKWDAFADKALLAMEDEFMKNPNIVYAVAVDKNGYVASHNTRYSRPLTGDKVIDETWNRTKRMFNNPVEIKGANNMQEGLIQVYLRSTGETMWDVASPILVKGKHWGNMRMGLSIIELQKAKNKLLLTLVGIMGAIQIIAIFAIKYIIKVTLAPLSTFTELASKMADGDVSQKIEFDSKDEIGELAAVLERMRISLKMAMERLMKR
jgi:methyl-accepting chemotaxis protein